MSSFRHTPSTGVVRADPQVLASWRVLRALAVLNVGLWLSALFFGSVGGGHGRLQLALSGVYVLVCAYRSLLPRVDLERLVVVDSPLSSVFLGRTAATLAEVCFALQLGLLCLAFFFAGLSISLRTPACPRCRRSPGRYRCSW